MLRNAPAQASLGSPSHTPQPVHSFGISPSPRASSPVDLQYDPFSAAYFRSMRCQMKEKSQKNLRCGAAVRLWEATYSHRPAEARKTWMLRGCEGIRPALDLVMVMMMAIMMAIVTKRVQVGCKASHTSYLSGGQTCSPAIFEECIKLFLRWLGFGAITSMNQSCAARYLPSSLKRDTSLCLYVMAGI